MKKLILVVTLLVGGLAVSALANVTYKFNPSPIDLSDLPHQYYYTWGINFNLPGNERITGATLTYYNIYDWTTEKNDALYTHLLDNPKPGVVAMKDYQSGGDNFIGQGALVGKWSDPVGGDQHRFKASITDRATAKDLDSAAGDAAGVELGADLVAKQRTQVSLSNPGSTVATEVLAALTLTWP